MEAKNVSLASWNYFHLATYPNDKETSVFKQVGLGAIKLISYFTVIIPLIMLAIHHRSTVIALAPERVSYKLPIYDQDPKIVALFQKTLDTPKPDKPKTIVPITPDGTLNTTDNTVPNDKLDDLKDLEKLLTFEDEFTDAILGDKDLHGNLEKTLVNVKDQKKCVNVIVESYVHFREKAGSSEMDESQIKYLEKYLNGQLENLKNLEMNPIGKKSAPVTPAIAKQPERYPGVAHKTRELPNNFRLNIYSTNGNGSCGIHALVGEPKKGEFRADDKKIRKDFCIWLRAKQIENMLPERIEQTLKDYLIYPEHAPDTFNNSNAVQEAREQLTPLRIEVDELRRERAQYQKSTGDLVTKNPNLDEAENRLAKLETMMIYDFEVVEAYLAVIKDTGQYLLQDELVAIAESLGKRIILFQPGWGEDRNKLQYSEITPEGTQVVSDLDPSQFSENTVCIYYNGLNHYEKAVVVKAE